MRRLQPSDPVSYRLKVGMDYGGMRHEAGEIVADIPQESLVWLLAEGYVEPVADAEGGE